MQKVVLSITAFMFFIWILPLGAFIKPSQEKKTCNGQRAICLCSHLIAKQMAKHAGETIYKSGSGAEQKEHSGPGSANSQFLPSQKDSRTHQHIAFYFHEQSLRNSLLFVRPIEHVPKV